MYLDLSAVPDDQAGVGQWKSESSCTGLTDRFEMERDMNLVRDMKDGTRYGTDVQQITLSMIVLQMRERLCTNTRTLMIRTGL